MTATRDNNLRRGDLAEGIGIELLRRFAAVAAVPRPEDFGLDAICTLLRQDKRKLYAEDTFAVQIKAASKREVEFSAEQMAWLTSLDVPFFLLSVDLKMAKAALYSLDGFPLQLPRERVFVLDKPDNVNPQRLAEMTDGSLAFWVGPAITELSLASLNDEARCHSLYELLKAWCIVVRTMHRARCVGVTRGLYWTTDAPPRLLGGSMHGPGTNGADELLGLFKEAAPVLGRMAMFAEELGHEDLVNGLKQVRDGVIKLGATADDLSMF